MDFDKLRSNTPGIQAIAARLLQESAEARGEPLPPPVLPPRKPPRLTERRFRLEVWRLKERCRQLERDLKALRERVREQPGRSDVLHRAAQAEATVAKMLRSLRPKGRHRFDARRGIWDALDETGEADAAVAEPPRKAEAAAGG